MSLKLERCCCTSLVRATLAVTLTVTAMMLAVFSTAAEAQTGDRSAPSVVVRPGDSLWSISEERLGQNATPQRVVNGARRIYALNRARIGADPNLIFVGQELLVPPAMSERPTGATPAHEVAEATGQRDRSAKGATLEAAKTVPRTVPDRADAWNGDASETVAARESEPAILPDGAAVAPVPAVRMVASKGARPSSVVSSLSGVYAGTHAEGRRLLGLGIITLTAVVAALVAAVRRNEGRRDARRRELRFREEYGSSYAASDPLASYEEASRLVSEVRDQTAPSDGPTNAGAASEDRFDRMDLFAAARAKRERIRRNRPAGLRRQSPQSRARGLRQPVRTRSQRRPLRGHRRMTTRAIGKEWEPSTALVNALGGLPLRPGAGQGENLARLKPHLEEAFGALERLERLRGLSEREKTRRESLRVLMATIERDE